MKSRFTFKYDTAKAVREIARERVGQPPARRVYVSKLRRPTKYKPRFEEE